MAVEFLTMNREQIDDFLQASRHAIVATNRIDGPPQISPVWYLYEDGKIYIQILVDSAKYRSLRRDPSISICVDGGHPDARAVTIYGNAELIDDVTDWRNNMFLRITRRYLESDEEARVFEEETKSGADDALVVVTPANILARDYN